MGRACVGWNRLLLQRPVNFQDCVVISMLDLVGLGETAQAHLFFGLRCLQLFLVQLHQQLVLLQVLASGRLPVQ